MKRFKIGFIGTGARSVQYARFYTGREDMEIAALCDPDENNRRAMAQAAGITESPQEFADWRDLYESRQDLDAVVICTPNHVHAEQAIPFLERGLPIVLEKPIAITQRDCERIVMAERGTAGRGVIGFVLRSTPFYARIRKLIADGAIGRILAIQANELIGWGVTSIVNRNDFKRYRRFYGSLILSKCCHDIDVLNWMMGSRPVSVHSYGRRNLFNPNPSLPDTCDDCRLADSCRYFKDPPMAREENAGDAVSFRFMRDNTRCIYNIEKEIVDTQSVSIEYENGAMAQFLLTLGCAGPRAGRNMHVVGHRGRIWGELAAKKVFHYDNDTEKLTEYDASGDGSGHGGGDRSLALELLIMLENPDYVPIHSIWTGYMSAITCLAADLSRREGRRVGLSYRDGGFAELR